MSSGTCGCQGYDLTQGDDYQTVMGMLSYVEFYIGGFSEDIQRRVVEIICNGVTNFGEHSQVTGVVELLSILHVRVLLLERRVQEVSVKTGAYYAAYHTCIVVYFPPANAVNSSGCPGVPWEECVSIAGGF